ncbi:hypothetical protein N0V88_000598 [Collariella sp. IMI 366227]|nr:hypothetical protein N0V88_000598 [Collariella sp. IMI 366227]
MKFAVVLSFISAAAAAVLEPRVCAGNNCNRAVTGTRSGIPSLSERSTLCASFLLTTVTPAASTVTVTVEPEVYYPVEPETAAPAVTVTPTAIPQYAGNCANGAEYLSACSCFGVTGSVTTAPVPTVTISTTAEVCNAL